MARARFLTKEEELYYGGQVQNMLAAQREMESNPDGLPEEKVVELNDAIRTGRRAVEVMVNANVRLVYKKAITFKNRFHSAPEIEDIVQDGMVGLMNAILKYDPKRNNKLSTVATYWIYQSISRQANKNSRMVRLPENRISEFLAIKRMRQELEDSGKNLQEADEIIMKELGLNAQDFWAILNAASSHVSLNQELNDDDSEGTELIDTIADDSADSVEEISLAGIHRQVLSEALEKLDEMERDVLSTEFLLDLPDGTEPMSPKDVKQKYRINVASYDRIVKRAVVKVRKHFNDHGFDDVKIS